MLTTSATMGAHLTKSKDPGRGRGRPTNVSNDTDVHVRAAADELPSYDVNTTRTYGTDDGNDGEDETDKPAPDNSKTNGGYGSHGHPSPITTVGNTSIYGTWPPANDHNPPAYTSLDIGGGVPPYLAEPSTHAASGVPAEPDDPLVAAARHNQAQPFHALPDVVLFGILSRLDNTSVECLRRVARKFPPLAAEVVRTRDFFQRDMGVPPRQGPFPWPRLRRMKSDWSAEGRALARLLDRDRYCADCLGARAAPDWRARVSSLGRYLECSACDAAHPACLFSRKQRRARRRRCIAHEGYVRICSHEGGIVRWEDVQIGFLYDEMDAKDPPTFFNGVRCWDRSHGTQCGGPDGDKRPENLSVHCEIPEHADKDENYPALRVIRDGGPNNEDEKSLCMEWAAHIPLGRLGEWPPTASSLRRHLTKLQDNAGRFMTMTTQPQMQLPELRCFDPNDCDCVYFEGSEDVDWRPYRPLQQRDMPGKDVVFSKCYLDPVRRLVSFPQRRRLSPATGDGHERLSSRPIRMCEPGAPQCLLAETGHMSRFFPVVSDARYGPGLLSIRASLCHSKSPCIRVSYRRYLAKPLPYIASSRGIPASWYLSLDPHSYGLTTDAEGYGVYWCREPKCCNYYRGSPGFSRLLLGYIQLQGEEEVFLEPLEYHWYGGGLP